MDVVVSIKNLQRGFIPHKSSLRNIISVSKEIFPVEQCSVTLEYSFGDVFLLNPETMSSTIKGPVVVEIGPAVGHCTDTVNKCKDFPELARQLSILTRGFIVLSAGTHQPVHTYISNGFGTLKFIDGKVA